MQNRQKGKRWISAILAGSLAIGAAAFFASCSKDGDENDPSGRVPTNQSIEHTRETPDNLKVYKGKLVIGTPGAEKELEYTIQKAPAEVDYKDHLAALAAETGWNLNTVSGNFADAITVSIQFTADASVFKGAEGAREGYTAAAGKDFTLLVLNSVAATLDANNCGSVHRFAGADGGALNISGFSWPADKNWDYEEAKKAW
ncbi:MAG: hypothetical protein LBC83_04800 [Oscillospiraceae bacterium]|jgi:hypothetical protein|nr:hypothetical protein [Oscillospiraceae bacterium]